MRMPAAGSYVCWRCLSRGAHSGLSSPRAAGLARSSLRGSAIRGHNASLVNRRAFATVQETPQVNSEDGFVPKIRQRLRQWEAENEVPAPKGVPADNGSSGKARNSLIRARHLDELRLDEGEGADLEQPLPDSDNFLDLLPSPSEFKAGDLIELQEDQDRAAILAICLGNLHGVYHFYTITGKWHPTPKTSSNFVVRGFVAEQLLRPIIDKLPKEALPFETLRAMKGLKMGPDRESGGALLRIMLNFQQKAEAAVQQYATRLENAHEILSNGHDRYLTLDQAATILIDRQSKREDRRTPIHTLFAVHRTIMTNDVGFRLVGALGPARKTVYEVTPPEDVALIHNMQTLVRHFTDIPGKVKMPLSALQSSVLSQSQIGRFILKARDAIDHSRRYRDWTPHGTLSPAKMPRPPLRAKWTDMDVSILHFMHLWAGCDQFSLSSSFQSIGSTILRALGRYKDSEFLSTSTGWTFLQEVGYLSPWEIHSRYTQRIPGIAVSRKTGFERMQLGPAGISARLTKDCFTGKRKEWTGHRVFAIDARDTVDIDDAVSIEKTDNPDEHWIHVHVADPASRIQHNSSLGRRAQLLPLNLYLSGHHSNIWGVGSEVQELFSLGADKPCLTFSGRVNNDGELLEYTITPGQLKDLIFITPEEVNHAVGFEDSRRPPAWSSTESFQVGQSPPKKPENRKMVIGSELRQDELDSLRALHRLAIAIQDRRLAKGSVPLFPLRANAKASFDGTSIDEASSGLMTCNGDPSISIGWNVGSEAPLVTNTMVLAGEIAARWCADRKIPIPFVKQSGAERNSELLKAYTERVYYPALLRGERPSLDQSRQFYDLVGSDEVSTRPGPHFILGLDAYAKVTSPLRRYSDLVAHWQIEHALLRGEERGSKEAVQKLPFSERKLDMEVFPWMVLRQRIIRRLDSVDGNDAYMHQALFRAWKYPSEHDSRLPDTFRFTARRAGAGFISGWLDWFGLDVRMVPDGLGRLGVTLSDIRMGDVFEVKLKDVNVHMGEVLVEAVGRPSTQEHTVA
ncbi:3'-5' RNA exonuclease complex component [Diaporthe eres]|uniref:3'-5' RNA exonuclease complex component n=1 Tax=Diaporthe eres TaxID=83184 RepID=A0ABR1PLA9_DIAER